MFQKLLLKHGITLRYTEDSRRHKYNASGENYHFGSLRTSNNQELLNFLNAIYYDKENLRFDRKFLKAEEFYSLINTYGVDARRHFQKYLRPEEGHRVKDVDRVGGHGSTGK